MAKEFVHRIVYRDKAEAEAQRCADCGSAPNIEWYDATVRGDGYREMFAAPATCPNGPHEVSDGEYHRFRQERLQQVADRAAARVEAQRLPRKKWWRRG